MRNLMVSIIISTYNDSFHLQEAIDSVIKQSFTDYELIIIDDGSTDNTRNVVEIIDDPRIRYHFKENGGPGSARNNGIEIARGEFVAFLDSDDYWDPGKLSQQLQCFHNNENADICITNEILVNSKGEEFRRNTRKLISGKLSKKVFSHLSINMSSVMLRRSLFEKTEIYFSEEKRYNEDWHLWMRLSEDATVCCVNKPLTYYRKQESGRATNNGEKIFKDAIYFINDALNHLKIKGMKDNDLSARRKAALYRCHSHYASFLCSTGQLKKVLAIYLRTVMLKPLALDNVKITIKFILATLNIKRKL